MASDIVPIQLSLTEGDLVTLWAPVWREDGEEWEAFLGDDDALFAFPEPAQLAAFVRTAKSHDLIDHPAWAVVPDLTVAELTPEDTQRYDVVGVPELLAQEADTWTIADLAQIVAMVRSIADVCDLAAVHEVLDSTPAFSMLDQGTLPFTGREGTRLWSRLVDTVAQRWDDVVDALDALVRVPEVDADALAAVEAEVARSDAEPAEADADAPAGFWDEVGIDPIRIVVAGADHLTLRCFLDDAPLFLGADGRIDAFPNARSLVRHLAGEGADDHDLAAVSTWPEVVERATSGDLDVHVADANVYDLTELDSDLAEGPTVVDPGQLELAAELLLDVGDWAGDTAARDALADNQPLGWLVSYVVRPDPTRLAPSPPFDTEAERWRVLVNDLVERLRTH
ncbi:primosomal protein [Pseudonocardia sp.]|uniref:primosomal protein n=1 Tax=Pseudonocardia sp. TaxID=60912 RepID=UPI003D120E62